MAWIFAVRLQQATGWLHAVAYACVRARQSSCDVIRDGPCPPSPSFTGTCPADASSVTAVIPKTVVASMGLSLSEGEPHVWCVGCDCFSRCVFGHSGGLVMTDPFKAFRACSQACKCILPPPRTGWVLSLACSFGQGLSLLYTVLVRWSAHLCLLLFRHLCLGARVAD